jgi:hypothetical protein
MTTDKLIIVLNKCDLLPEEERELRIEKMTNKLRKIFETTKFTNSPIIATSASIGGVGSVGSLTAAEVFMIFCSFFLYDNFIVNKIRIMYTSDPVMKSSLCDILV